MSISKSKQEAAPMAAEGAGAGARVVVALSRSCRWRGGTGGVGVH